MNKKGDMSNTEIIVVTIIMSVLLVLWIMLSTGVFDHEEESIPDIIYIDFIYEVEKSNESNIITWCSDEFSVVRGNWSGCAVSTNIVFPFGVTRWELCGYLWEKSKLGRLCSDRLFNEDQHFVYYNELNETITRIIIKAKDNNSIFEIIQRVRIE